jgi:hypothetical protein
MAKPDALKRLGGGRWETKDGRFQIEPQSGTWVIVDTTQTNEFGLPLVRGPFGSLTAAREAIETARVEGPIESPLAERIEQARHVPEEPKPSEAESPKPAGAKKRLVAEAEAEAEPTKKGLAAAGEAKPAADRGQTKKPAAAEPEPEKAPEPEPPAEPKWIRELGATDRRKARQLIERLNDLDISDAEEIARGEFARREPALARAALERELRAATRSSRTPRAAVSAAIEIILAGKDDELETEWKLTDGQGRRIDSLDLAD